MKIKKYTLKFLALGKDKKTYLRYYCTVNNRGESYNIPCDVQLTPEQIELLNEGKLGGMIQKQLLKLKDSKEQAIRRFYVANNTYPSAEQLRLFDKSVASGFNFDYYFNQYMQQLQIKAGSKRVYNYAIGSFKDFYVKNLLRYSIEDIISKDTIKKYGEFQKDLAKITGKNITPAHIHNYQSIAIRFLNYVAESLHLQKIEFFLNLPEYSAKWHIDEADVQRLLAHTPQTKTQAVVQDIIRINSLIGLRIGELLTIMPENISVENTVVKKHLKKVMYIRFAEHKKSKERTIVIVDAQAIEILSKYLNNGKYLWSFQHHNWFNVVLQDIAKAVFGEETIQIYRNTLAGCGYVEVLKYKAISSHAFRRFGIERNIVKYGADVARTFSGHKDTAIMYKHYADFMKSEDLKNKLLGS